MITKFFDQNKDAGILILRLGIGLPFIFISGLMKIQSGPELWTQIGGAMSKIGITFFPVFWGFMASISEFVGGILIVLGLFTRPAAAFMAFTMIIASIFLLSMRDQWYNVVTPIEMLAVFIALMFLGAGKFSLDYLFFKKEAS